MGAAPFAHAEVPHVVGCRGAPGARVEWAVVLANVRGFEPRVNFSLYFVAHLLAESVDGHEKDIVGICAEVLGVGEVDERLRAAWVAERLYGPSKACSMEMSLWPIRMAAIPVATCVCR